MKNNKENLTFEKSFIGFKYLKEESLKMLLPLSYVENGEMVKECNVPCFYKTSGDLFVYFLPSIFLKEVNVSELLSGNNIDLKHFERDCIHREKDGSKYVYFSFKSLKELRESVNDENSLFNKFKTVYEEYQLDIKNGEQVIFVAFKNKEGTNLSGNMFSSGKDFLEKYKIVFSSNSKFEYFQAYKFNNRYYLINEDKSIDQKASFSLNKNQDLSLNYLIMEYTDKDWTMCQDINKKIIELKNKVDNLFSNQHNVGLLDKPLSESANPLLLEVLSTFKKPKI